MEAFIDNYLLRNSVRQTYNFNGISIDVICSKTLGILYRGSTNISRIAKNCTVTWLWYKRSGVIFRNYVSLTVSRKPHGSIRGMGVREGLPIGSYLIGRFCTGVCNVSETREKQTFNHPSSDDATVSHKASSISTNFSNTIDEKFYWSSPPIRLVCEGLIMGVNRFRIPAIASV